MANTLAISWLPFNERARSTIIARHALERNVNSIAISPTSDRAGLLLTAKCHVADEIGGLHFKAFDCADR
jgi:hypothetical protein